MSLLPWLSLHGCMFLAHGDCVNLFSCMVHGWGLFDTCFTFFCPQEGNITWCQFDISRCKQHREDITAPHIYSHNFALSFTATRHGFE